MPVEPTLLRTVAPLGTAQTLAWASSYYLPAMLATPMARDLGVSAPTVFAAFSLALIVLALIGPWAGQWIDRHGGRRVLMATNLVFCPGSGGAGLSPRPVDLGRCLGGLGAGHGQRLVRGRRLPRSCGSMARPPRSPITGITLFAGFASTIGWPLSTLMEAQFGWRGACFGWGRVAPGDGTATECSLASCGGRRHRATPRRRHHRRLQQPPRDRISPRSPTTRRRADS